MARSTAMPPRVLLVRLDEGQQYNLPHRHANIIASAGVLEDGRFRGASSFVYEHSEPKGVVTEPALRDLKITCAMATNMESISYGWDIEYRQPYNVDLQRAEEMVKALRIVQRKMNRIHQLIGRPATFGQYLARAAQALSVTTILIERFEHRNVGYNRLSDDQRYITSTVSSAVDTVDRLVAEYHTTYPSTYERFVRECDAADARVAAAG